MERKNSIEEILVKIDDVTFQAYLGCRDVIGVNEIEILTEIFERLNSEHLVVGKVVQDENIVLAVKFKPVDESKAATLKSNNNFENNDENRDKKFLESTKALATVLPLLNNDDRLGLNRLFSSIFQLGRGIGEKQIRENGEEYYPIKYSGMKEKTHN